MTTLELNTNLFERREVIGPDLLEAIAGKIKSSSGFTLGNTQAKQVSWALDAMTSMSPEDFEDLGYTEEEAEFFEKYGLTGNIEFLIDLHYRLFTQYPDVLEDACSNGELTAVHVVNRSAYAKDAMIKIARLHGVTIREIKEHAHTEPAR